MLCLVKFQKFQTQIHQGFSVHIQRVLLLSVYRDNVIFPQPFFPQAVYKWWAITLMSSSCYPFVWKALVNRVYRALEIAFCLLKAKVDGSEEMLFINFNIYLTLFCKITLMPDFPFLIFCRKSGGSLAKPVHTGISLRGREHILTMQTIYFCGRSSFLMSHIS